MGISAAPSQTLEKPVEVDNNDVPLTSDTEEPVYQFNAMVAFCKAAEANSEANGAAVAESADVAAWMTAREADIMKLNNQGLDSQIYIMQCAADSKDSNALTSASTTYNQMSTEALQYTNQASANISQQNSMTQNLLTDMQSILAAFSSVIQATSQGLAAATH